MKTKTWLILLFFPTLLLANPKPKLIVQLVIDQLRGDLIQQYQKEFGPNGFNYLLSHGINYQNAHHPHANTVTCAGHATIATGTYPALHGIINNHWFDRLANKIQYCVEDQQNPIIASERTIKTVEGRSPINIIASTFSDELVLAKQGRAFAVSLKDRGAITLAGHAGKAFWFDKENGGFVSSVYYYNQYPHWVSAWNKAYHPKDDVWDLSQDKSLYNHANSPRFMNRYPTFGINFPHQLGKVSDPEYYKFFSMTPFADELTADFAINLLKNENIGQAEGKTDYLGISFSAVDAIGHQFGPNSLESEDNLLRLDKTLAKLFAALEDQVGLGNTLIILTADHGVSDSSVYLAKNHLFQRQSLTPTIIQEFSEKTLASEYKLPANAIQSINLPFIYLNHQIINQQHLSVDQVKQFLAEKLNQFPGIFKVYTFPLTKQTIDWLDVKMSTMDYTKRVGDLYIVTVPYQTIVDRSVGRVSHGTPWNYDSYVPLVFANKSFSPQQISQKVETIDIAPTLSSLLGIRLPSSAVGTPLINVVRQFKG